MAFDTRIIACVTTVFARTKAVFAGRAVALIAARRRRIEHDREFYRNLDTYCRANNLPLACEDDWKVCR